MKKNIVFLVIILFSIFSGFIGSYIGINFYNGKLENKEIIKTEKYTSLSSLQNDITKIVKDISPSIVSIIIKKDLTVYRRDPFGFFQTPVGTYNRKVGGGSGFFITKDGKIITNKHVISDKNANYTVITNDGKEYDAKIIAIDPITDLAILQISGNNFKPLKIINNSSDINIGEFVIAVGNALAEYQNSVSLGVISGKNRSISDENINLSGLLQTDAAINPGNSGGPLVNLNGEVIGISTAIVNGAESLGFSIPLTQERIDYMMKSIKKYGTIKRPFIGINYILVSPGIQKELGLSYNYGAYVLEEDGGVLHGSSAEKTGIKPGDLILEANSKKINFKNNLNSIIQTKIPGDKIKLKVFSKDGKLKNINLILGEGE